MEYKVCGPQGCFDSDSGAAVGQAIVDGVDVINFSISGGTDPFTDSVELAFLGAYAAGVFVSASAGNEGPGARTANHLSPWVTTVAASTQTREFATALTLNASNGDTFTVNGASITPGVGPLPVVLSSAAPYSNPLCDAPAPRGLFSGKIVACQRGVNPRVQKGYNVLQGGATGVILYNPSLADVETDTHWLPTVHLADGTDFLAFMNSHSGVTGSFPRGQPETGGVMSWRRSRLGGLAGCSSSPTSPHRAFRSWPAIRRSWRTRRAARRTSTSRPSPARRCPPRTWPGRVCWSGPSIPTGRLDRSKSSLMTTAITDVVKEDLVTPADPFDFGAGRIHVGRSIYAPLTLDETAGDFAALGGDPVNVVHLNVPSINAPVMPGRLVTTRVVKNASGRPERFTATTHAPPGSSITVNPRRFRLDPGAERTLTVIIESDAPIGEQQFGRINLGSSSGAALHLPVAFIHTQGNVSLTQPAHRRHGRRRADQLSPRAAAQRDPRRCPARRAGGGSGLAVRLHPARCIRRHARADRRRRDHQFLRPTLRVRQPDLGCHRCRLERVHRRGWRHRRGPQLLQSPDRARSGAPQQHARAVLDRPGRDGCGGYLRRHAHRWDEHMARRRVPRERLRHHQPAGLSDLDRHQRCRRHHLRLRPANLPADPNGQDFLVGAENVLGQGDMEAVLPSADLRVQSTDAVPGDRATYTLTVRGVQRGVGTVTTEMEASGVPGITVVKTDIRVLRGDEA